MLVALLAAAVVVAILARRSVLPYTVGLVLFGLVLSFVGPAIAFPVNPRLLLAIVLPGLVFEAAVRTDLALLGRSAGWILLLAIPGVIIVAAIVAAVLATTTSLTVSEAFLVGAMVAATDPAAILATFRHLGVAPGLETIVEMESLVNDGTGIVLFSVALAFLVEGGSGDGSGAGPAVAFGVAIVGSVVAGVLLGALAARIIRATDDHLTQLAITVVLAYGSYLIADGLGLSGVIATLVAGGAFGTLAGDALSDRTRETIDVVWEFAAFLLTAGVFLLVGLAISPASLRLAAEPIVWGVLATLVARGLVVYGLLGIPSWLLARLGRLGAAIPGPWLHVLAWAGLRGAVSVALALSIPAGLPHRDLIQGVTFGIVLFTLVVQGSTAGLVVRRSGALDQASDGE